MPTKHIKTAAKPTTDALPDLSDTDLGSLAWLGTAWVEAMADVGSEVTHFVSQRIAEDVKTQHELLHCKTLTELQQAQAAFLERAYVQYTVETGKLVDLGTSVVRNLSTKTKATPL